MVVARQEQARRAAPAVRRRRKRVIPVLPNQVHQPTQVKRYYNVFADFMEWKNGTTYPDDHFFTLEEKNAITPSDIHRWFCLKAYGMENPSNEDNPTLTRSNSLIYYKKAISYFISSNQEYNETRRDGNPTRSPIINRLICTVRRKETRGVGSASQSDREFTSEEMEQVIDGFSVKGGHVISRRHSAPSCGKRRRHC